MTSEARQRQDAARSDSASDIETTQRLGSPSFHDLDTIDTNTPNRIAEWLEEFEQTARVEESVRTALSTYSISLQTEPEPDKSSFESISAESPSTEHTFELVASWDGLVTEVGEESFQARVTRLDRENIEYEIELSIDDVDEGERHRLVPGALFYWHIGYEKRHRPRRRVSEFWLRRINVSSWPTLESEATKTYLDLFDDE